MTKYNNLILNNNLDKYQLLKLVTTFSDDIFFIQVPIKKPPRSIKYGKWRFLQFESAPSGCIKLYGANVKLMNALRIYLLITYGNTNPR